MKKALTLFLCLFCLSSVFASLEVEDILALKDKSEAVVLAVSASYTNVPRLFLEGVSYQEGEGVLPKNVHFSSSDASTYYNSLSSQQKGGFWGFISKLTSSISPLNKMALDKLEAMDFKSDDFIIDGDIFIDGGESLTLSTILFGRDFSFAVIDVTGALLLSGNTLKEDYDIKFDFHCVGKENRAILIDIKECNINGATVSVEPFVVSFEVF